MGWKEESQFRFHYTSDGNSEMSWQPTSVYVPDTPEDKPLSGTRRKSDAKEVFLFFSSTTIATLVYQYVSHVSYIVHLSVFPQRVILGTAILGSFLGSMVLLEKKIVQAIIKVGIVVLCIAIFLLRQ